MKNTCPLFIKDTNGSRIINNGRKIISTQSAASKSKARQKIFKQLGLKYTICPSNAREKHTLANGPSKLVVSNSLLKANDIAKKKRKGIIISADTIVLAGKKLIGKPKNLNDAINTIKILSRKPHFVYSGLCVIDTSSGKIYTAWDRTKVFMTKLTDEQIKNYCKKYSPLDKAGSFDIQGAGGLFVQRIEGCFYNVVGLPLAKLVKILQKLNVDVFED